MATHEPTAPGARRIAIGISAAAVSSIGLTVAGAAAAERAGAGHDKLIVGMVSCSIVLAAHLLPAVSRSIAVRALWAVCLALAAWGHAAYFAAAAGRAGDERAARVHEPAEAAPLRAALASISARPIAAVAADIAAADARVAAAAAALARCRAVPGDRCTWAASALAAHQSRAGSLAVEMAEARRAAEIMAELAGLAARADSDRAAAADDPIARGIGAMLGIDASVTMTAASIISAVAIELIAACLWMEAFRVAPTTYLPRPARPPAPPQQVGALVAPKITRTTLDASRVRAANRRRLAQREATGDPTGVNWPG